MMEGWKCFWEVGGPGRRLPRRLFSRLWSRGRGNGGPLRRSREDRLLCGAAAGGGPARTGVDVTVVRLVFVLAALLSVGAAAYVLAWLFISMAGEDGTIAGRAMTDRRDITLVAAVGSLLILVLVVASIVGASWISNLSWPLVLSAAGLAPIWRNAPADEQETMRRLTEPLGAAGTRLGMAGPRKKSRTIARAALTGVLLIGGLALLLSGHDGAELLRPVGGLILVVAAIMVLLGPWWLRIALGPCGRTAGPGAG